SEDAAERERQVGLELTGRRPAVLGHTGAVEEAKALQPFREREPRARLRAVRTVTALRSFVEVDLGLEADRAAVTASRVGLYGHGRLLLLSACISQSVAIYTTACKMQALSHAVDRAAFLLSDQPVTRDLRGRVDLARAAGHDVFGQAALSRAAAVRRTHLVEHPRGPARAARRARPAYEVR